MRKIFEFGSMYRDVTPGLLSKSQNAYSNQPGSQVFAYYRLESVKILDSVRFQISILLTDPNKSVIPSQHSPDLLRQNAD